MGVSLLRPHWPRQLLCMSITALPGTALSIRFDSPGPTGRLSNPDKAHLSGLAVHSRSGAKPILASAAAETHQFPNQAAHPWPVGHGLSECAHNREGGPACL